MASIYDEILDTKTDQLKPNLNFVLLLDKWNNLNYYTFLGIEPGKKVEDLSEDKKEFLLKHLHKVKKILDSYNATTKISFDKSSNEIEQIRAINLLLNEIIKATNTLYFLDSKQKYDNEANTTLTDLSLYPWYESSISPEYKKWWNFVKNICTETDIQLFINMNKKHINDEFNRENMVYAHHTQFCNPLRVAIEAYDSDISFVKHLLLAGAKLPKNIHGLVLSIQNNIFNKLAEILDKIETSSTRAEYIAILLSEKKLFRCAHIEDFYEMLFKNPIDAEKKDLIKLLQIMSKSRVLEIFKLSVAQCNTACISLVLEAMRMRPELKIILFNANKKGELDLQPSNNKSKNKYFLMLQMLLNYGFTLFIALEQNESIERNAKLATVANAYRATAVGKIGKFNIDILDRKSINEKELAYANASTFVCAVLTENESLVEKLINNNPLQVSDMALHMALLTCNQAIIKMIVKVLPFNRYPQNIEQILSICNAETKLNVPLDQYKSEQFHLAQSRNDENLMKEALQSANQVLIQVQPSENLHSETSKDKDPQQNNSLNKSIPSL